jgi:peroxiredoxin
MQEVQHFGVPILADYDHEVSKAYVGLYEDVLPANLRLTSKRAVLGISRDGILSHAATNCG